MNIIKLQKEDLKDIYELFNEYVEEGKFLKYLSYSQFEDKLLSNPSLLLFVFDTNITTITIIKANNANTTIIDIFLFDLFVLLSF